METDDSHKSNKYCTRTLNNNELHLIAKANNIISRATLSCPTKTSGRQHNQVQKAIEKMMNEAISSGRMGLKIMTSMLLFMQFLNLTDMPVQGALMNLPDGIENVLGFIPRSTFQCERDGYFGDIDNDCRIFHLCQKQVHAGGRIEWRHWTYACGNQTMFNQLTLTCAFVDEAIPCKHASQFQYLNEVIHKPREPFLTDADVTSGVSYYSNRIMSDGARARAFEDSQLMAQLGGSSVAAQVQAPNAASSSSFQPSIEARDSEEGERSENNSPNSIDSSSDSFLPAHFSTFHFQDQQQALLRQSQLNNEVLQHQQQQGQPQQAQQQQAVFQSNLQSLKHFRFFEVPQQQVVAGVPSELQKTRAPESFGFSISTNHQAQQANQQPFLPSSHEPLVTLSTPSATPFPIPVPTTQQQQQQRQQQQLVAAGATTSTSTTVTGFPQLVLATQATTITSAPVSSRQNSNADPTLATTTAANIAANATTQRIAPATKQPIATSSNPLGGQLRRRQVSVATTLPADRSGRPTRPPSNSNAGFRSVGSFHSTRISTSSPLPTNRREFESALVMRRQQQQQQQQSVAPTLPASASANSARQEESAGMALMDFWRRPFDAQFLTSPRFESLLARRRV